jgi:restriction endonuclease Mrr
VTINLNYSEYLIDEYEYDLSGSVNNPTRIEYKLPEEYKSFYKKRGYCPFCHTAIQNVYKNQKSATLGADLFETIDIWECDCGFWEAFSSFTEEKDLITEIDSKNWQKLYYSKVASVEDSKKEKAVKQLVSEIKNNSARLYSIDPLKFEQIAQYVFSAFFKCEVEHVGKSHDGGVDLLIVNSDKPILVQVKRREKANSVESVSTVRDFLGAMYIKNNFNGIILSTAKSFSKPSQKVILDLKSQNRLESFELFDFSRFCSILNVVDLSRKNNWEFLYESWR